MTKKLEDTLNLPHLDDLLKEEGVMNAVEEEDPALNEMLQKLDSASESMSLIEGKDHADAMDSLYKETLDHARNIADLGYNVDHARAARIFEVGAQFFKIAMDAKNSKRDAQLKAMHLMLQQQKMEQEKGTAQTPNTVDVDAIVVEDRNELIRRIREQANKEKP